MTNEVRFVLHPGYVVSRTDGQRHYIGIGQLHKLYGLRRNDRVVVASAIELQYLPGDTHLYPRFDGHYERVHVD